MTARLWLLLMLLPLLIVTACYASRPCYTPEEAAEHAGKEICLSAHIYDLTETPDGVRYLDVCPPETPSQSCRFAVVSMAEDRKEVGVLESLRDRDVHLRGIVHDLHGQSMMLLSHARQLKDGPEKFRPNPQLLAGFNAGNGGMAFKDPAMTGHRQRSASLFKAAAGTSHTIP